LLISRFGSTELSYIFHYVRNNKKPLWSDEQRKIITELSGFFPTTDENLNKFCQIYIDSLKQIDILGVWYKPGEDYFIKKYLKKTKLVPLAALEPYYHAKPWSTYLTNKNVLVIHPFAETIKKQYEKRKLLFSNQEVLPDFNLKLIKAVQSLNASDERFSSWFEALEYMQQEINKIDFDIAIIGAGAYGLPLGAYIKKMGKKVIHLGGATQILFGIIGKRWEELEDIKKLMNEHWIRPQEQEKPKGKLPENGCYW